MQVWLTDCLPAALTCAAAVWYTWNLHRGESVEQLMAARRAWLRKVMSTKGHELLAVQTVRNSLMAASLMATTAALGVAGVLNTGKEAAVLAHELSEFMLGATAGWVALKTALLAAILGTGFLLFSLSVRFYHRVGYTLAGFTENDNEILERGASELMRGAAFYRAGWRAMYAAIAAAAWFFGSWAMCVAGCFAMYLDHKVIE